MYPVLLLGILIVADGVYHDIDLYLEMDHGSEDVHTNLNLDSIEKRWLLSRSNEDIIQH